MISLRGMKADLALSSVARSHQPRADRGVFETAPRLAACRCPVQEDLRLMASSSYSPGSPFSHVSAESASAKTATSLTYFSIER
jgi:hypothetical protein